MFYSLFGLLNDLIWGKKIKCIVLDLYRNYSVLQMCLSIQGHFKDFKTKI